MDPVQKVLIAVIVVLTVLLLVVGLQVLLVIIDLRRSVKRLNSILEDAVLGGGLIRPEKITSLMEMFKKRKNTSKMGLGDTYEGETIPRPTDVTDRV